MLADKNDGRPWSADDLEDLKRSIEAGSTLAETAIFLGRAGTLEDVLKTAAAHGWTFQRLSKFSTPPK